MKDLELTFGRDFSYKGDLRSLQRDIDTQVEGLEKTLSQCCEKFGIGCDTNVTTERSLAVPTPAKGNKYDTNKDIDKVAGELGGGINVLFTQNLPGTQVGVSARGADIIIEKNAPAYTLSHELGHSAGFDYPGGPDKGMHSSKGNDLMFKRSGGTNVDECYCRKVNGL